MEKGMLKGGLAKERNPYGRVLHDRGTSSKPSKFEGIGNEKHENVRGAQEGGDRAEAAGMGPGHSHLGHATAELRAQHPHHHSVGGVHHTADHIRHVPMHGMGVESRHGHSARMSPGRSHGHPEHNHRDLK